MSVIISMLRGVNLARHRRLQMSDLRALYEDLGFRDAQTYVQSGNVVCHGNGRDLGAVARKIELAIERKFGFQSDVIVRTTAEMRDAVARNPFAGRRDIQPSKLLVTFLASDPGDAVREKIRAIKADPEELAIEGRELYIYYANGMARPKVSPALMDRILGVPWTGRNWNTATKLLEMAEALEAATCTSRRSPPAPGR